MFLHRMQLLFPSSGSPRATTTRCTGPPRTFCVLRENFSIFLSAQEYWRSSKSPSSEPHDVKDHHVTVFYLETITSVKLFRKVEKLKEVLREGSMKKVYVSLKLVSPLLNTRLWSAKRSARGSFRFPDCDSSVSLWSICDIRTVQRDRPDWLELPRHHFTLHLAEAMRSPAFKQGDSGSTLCVCYLPGFGQLGIYPLYAVESFWRPGPERPLRKHSRKRNKSGDPAAENCNHILRGAGDAVKNRSPQETREWSGGRGGGNVPFFSALLPPISCQSSPRILGDECEARARAVPAGERTAPGPTNRDGTELHSLLQYSLHERRNMADEQWVTWYLGCMKQIPGLDEACGGAGWQKTEKRSSQSLAPEETHTFNVREITQRMKFSGLFI